MANGTFFCPYVCWTYIHWTEFSQMEFQREKSCSDHSWTNSNNSNFGTSIDLMTATGANTMYVPLRGAM
jgi:hypothetical protein